LVTLVTLVVLGVEITLSTVLSPVALGVVLIVPLVLTLPGSDALTAAVVLKLLLTADAVVESKGTRYLIA
jgi:hypothetical protein